MKEAVDIYGAKMVVSLLKSGCQILLGNVIEFVIWMLCEQYSFHMHIQMMAISVTLKVLIMQLGFMY